MRNKSEQMSLFDTYKGVAASMEEDKPKLFRLLDEHIDWDTLVPARFYMAFYQNTGRPRKYPLVAFLKSLVLQKIFCYVNDSVLLVTLRHSREMRKFCGFSKVPDAAKLTRFKQDFLPYIMEVFERLVELTEPICREMDAELAGSLIYDTTGIESYVAENNPKFFSSKLRQAKLMAKTNPNTDPYRAVYGLLPDCAAASPAVKQQYINGHFCYAQKAGLLTNGLGIVRHIAFFDDAFKKSHPEIPIDKCTDNQTQTRNSAIPARCSRSSGISNSVILVCITKHLCSARSLRRMGAGCWSSVRTVSRSRSWRMPSLQVTSSVGSKPRKV